MKGEKRRLSRHETGLLKNHIEDGEGYIQCTKSLKSLGFGTLERLLARVTVERLNLGI